MKINDCKKNLKFCTVTLDTFEVDVLHTCVKLALIRKVDNSDDSNVSTLFELLAKLKYLQNNLDLPF